MKVVLQKVYLGESNRQPQPSGQNLECYPFKVKKALLEMASDNHSRIFGRSPQMSFLNFVYCVFPYPYVQGVIPMKTCTQWLGRSCTPGLGKDHLIGLPDCKRITLLK